MTDLTNGVRPPQYGEKMMQVCHDCGYRFIARKSMLPVKCPNCGSIFTGKDFMIVY